MHERGSYHLHQNHSPLFHYDPPGQDEANRILAMHDLAVLQGEYPDFHANNLPGPWLNPRRYDDAKSGKRHLISLPRQLIGVAGLTGAASSLILLHFNAAAKPTPSETRHSLALAFYHTGSP
jgi:hypothetical protein